ncbi:MAG TPA: carboxypeptidase-like regulatory domain-containing protein, partial [Thermoanaerobaculia bacterium]
MAKTWWRGVLYSVSILALLSAPGFSQTQATTGVISGTVVDPSDAALPGASVVIRNTATNFEKTETTDTTGRFRAILLPLGPYRITASIPGFTTVIREGVTLSVGQEVNLKLQLQISPVQQEVKVTGEAPVVEISRTAGATLIDSEAVQNLPNASHNFLDFTKLTP